MANSAWQRIENNAIFKVPQHKKRQVVPAPSQSPTFNYTAQLADSMWLRRRARRLRYG